MTEPGRLVALLDASFENPGTSFPIDDAVSDLSLNSPIGQDNDPLSVCDSYTLIEQNLISPALTPGFQPSSLNAERPVLEIYVQGDPQNESLYGEWSIWKGSVAKALVPASIRDMPLSLFGFAVDRHLNDQFREYDEANDYPTIYLHSGDVTDKGCPVELDLAWAAIQTVPDAVTPGNHIFHQGFMTSEDDIWGFTSLLLGPQNYVEEIWEPSCGGDHLTKGIWIESAGNNIYGFNKEEVETRLVQVSSDTYQIDGKETKKWDLAHNAADIVSDFWHRGDKTDFSVVRLVNQKLAPEIDTIILAVTKKRITLPDDTQKKVYILVTDSVDYTDGKPPIPGMDPGFSSLQANLWLAYIETTRNEDPDALFLSTLTHPPLTDFYNPKTGDTLSWERFKPVLEKSGVLLNISGHRHRPVENELENQCGFNGDIVDHTAAAAIDYPHGAMRLLLWADPDKPGSLISEKIDVGLSLEHLHVTEDVLKQIEQHEGDLLAYRQASDELPEEERHMLQLEKDNYWQWASTAISYMTTRGAFYENPVMLIDLARVQELQYLSMISYLKSVVELLDDDQALLRDELEIHIAELEFNYADWKPKFDSYRADYKAYQNSSYIGSLFWDTGLTEDDLIHRGRELLNLFSFNHEDESPCVTQVQFLLREIPMDTEADAFMTLMAMRAGKEEYEVNKALHPNFYTDKHIECSDKKTASPSPSTLQLSPLQDLGSGYLFPGSWITGSLIHYLGIAP